MLRHAPGLAFLDMVGAITDRESERRWSDVLFHADDATLRERLRPYVEGPGLPLTEQARANLARLPDPLPARPPSGDARVEAFVKAIAPNVYVDLSILGPVARVLAALPVVEVAEYVVRFVTVVGIGLDARAVTARLAPFPADRLVLIFATDDPGTIRHEIAHAFYEFDPSVPPAADMSALAVARARRAGERNPDSPSGATLAEVAAAERRADVLAAVWGFLA